MITEKRLSQLLFFDIETRGKYPDFHQFHGLDPEGAHIWEKKAERQYKDMTAAEAYQNKVSIYAEFGEITCLSYGVWKPEGMQISSIYAENEKEVLQKISYLFRKASANGLTPTGWNIKGFDIPWIFRKMLMNGMDVPECISSFEKKPWEVNILDLKDLWKSWCTIDCNFEEAAYAMGIPSPKDDIDGSQTHAEFWKGNLERVVTYCEKDVKAMILMAEKFAKIKQHA